MWLLARLEKSDDSALGILDDRLCISVDVLPLLDELADVATAAGALAVREPERVASRFPAVVGALHWSGVYFVHYAVCGLTHQELRKRVVRRLAPLYRLAGPLAGPIATGMRLGWELGIEGSTPGARKLLPDAVRAMEAIARQLPVDAAACADVIARFHVGAGQDPARKR